MARRVLACQLQPFNGGGSFTLPSTWTSVNTITIIGAGSRNPNNITGTFGGGGGGAFAQSSNVIIAPGTTIYIGYEYQGTGADGAWVNFGSNQKPTTTAQGVFAASGQSTNAGIVTAGLAGGQAADCIGDIAFSGGNGGAGSSGLQTGGGGGGPGGPGGAGKNGGDGDTVSGRRRL